MTKTFKGKRSFFGNQVTVTCNDKPLEPRLDLVEHSPMGSYHGSIPEYFCKAK
ncbi:MAG: hypothetical protein Q8M39_08425 [Sulfuricurvum sp.]|nr:hypothetical protein [Sulfuricurvum sp.]